MRDRRRRGSMARRAGLKVALLDVNVLIALLWPAHEHHEAAHRWFRSRRGARWATCPLTELAFVRIVTNPAFSEDALAPRDAVTLLAVNLARPAHEFWPADLSLSDAFEGDLAGIRGHRQVTDLYLLSLAIRHEGVLASFDGGMAGLARARLESALEVISTEEV